MMVESRDPGGAPPAHGAPGHNCLTGCAGTFKRAMREKRLSRVLVQLNRINENLEDLEVREEDENMREEEEKEGSCEMEPRTKEQQRRAAARKSCSLSPYRELEDFRRKCSVIDTNKGRKLSLDLGSTSELADLLNLDKISSLIQTIDKQVEKKRGEGEEGYDKEKRRLSLAKILRPPGPDLVEGVYTLTGSKDFDLFLQAIGTGPLSRSMVLGAKVKVEIYLTPDKQWQISTETAIKAKSVKGYATYNRKLTQNKFKECEGKPELLDDWDQRFVVTTLIREDDGARLKLDQVAEKDQKHCADSTVVFEIDRANPAELTITYTVGDIIAWRKFERVPPKSSGGRRHSIV